MCHAITNQTKTKTEWNGMECNWRHLRAFVRYVSTPLFWNLSDWWNTEEYQYYILTYLITFLVLRMYCCSSLYVWVFEMNWRIQDNSLKFFVSPGSIKNWSKKFLISPFLVVAILIRLPYKAKAKLWGKITERSTF